MGAETQTNEQQRTDLVNETVNDARRGSNGGEGATQAVKEVYEDLIKLKQLDGGNTNQWQEDLKIINARLRDAGQPVLPDLEIVDVGPNNQIVLKDDKTQQVRTENLDQFKKDVRRDNELGAVLNGDPREPGDIPTAEQLKAAGLESVRISFTTKNYTPENAEIWKKVLKEYKEAGIEVTINLPPEFVDYPGTRNRLPDEYRARFMDKLDTVMKEFGDYIDHYEIGNEPDKEPDGIEKTLVEEDDPKNPGQKIKVLKDVMITVDNPDKPGEKITIPKKIEPDSGMDPKLYGKLYNEARAKIREFYKDKPEDQRADTIIGGLSTGQTEWLKKTGIENPDGIALHLYGANDPEVVKAKIAEYRDLYKDATGKPIKTPIYLTEIPSENIAAQTEAVRTESRVEGMVFWGRTSDSDPRWVQRGISTNEDLWHAVQDATRTPHRNIPTSPGRRYGAPPAPDPHNVH